MANIGLKVNKNGKSGGIKKRSWEIIVYPDSAPENWHDILEKTGLPIAIGPLHDKDLNPDGTTKKPHWHVLLVWENPTTQNNVKTIADALNAPLPTGLESLRGAYDYLWHKNNPEKFQYNAKDVIRLNGFDIANYAELTKAETLELKKEIFGLIQNNDLTEYNDLLLYLQAIERDDLFDIAINNTLAFNSILKSRRHGGKSNA